MATSLFLVVEFFVSGGREKEEEREREERRGTEEREKREKRKKAKARKSVTLSHNSFFFKQRKKKRKSLPRTSSPSLPR